MTFPVVPAVIPVFHTRGSNFRSVVSFMVLALVLCSAYGFGSEVHRTKPIATEHSSIVYSAGDEGGLVIREGSITAVEGASVRLLPGTHVKKGENLTVRIVSKEYQEELASEAKEEERKKTVASIIETQTGKTPAVKSAFTIRNIHEIPGQQTRLGQARYTHLGLQVRVQTSPTTPVTALYKQSTQLNIHTCLVMAFRTQHFPSYSWGERSETIKVILS